LTATKIDLAGLIQNVNHNHGNNPEDSQLVNRVLSGDNHAFGKIINNTEGLVAQIVFKMIPVAEDRKDLVQDIYLKVFHNLCGFKFQSKLSTWIARIAYNTCISWIEKKKPLFPGNLSEDDEMEDNDGNGYSRNGFAESETRIFQKELSSILYKEIESLPTVWQTLILLYHQESMSYEELADITNLPMGTIKSHLFRARKMLKEKLLSKYKKEAL
jgi:RNA polymerase sigma factor (sigma-70 family)